MCQGKIKAKTQGVVGPLGGIVTLIALAFTMIACNRNEEQSSGALELEELAVELSVFSPDGTPTSLEVDLESLTKSALSKSKHLRLGELRDHGDGPRLRVQTQVSVDGRSKEVHALIKGRIDRAGDIPMSWEVDQARDLTKNEAKSLDPGRTTAQLEKSLALLVSALDDQVELTRSERDRQREALRTGSAPMKLAAARSLAEIERSKRGPVIADLCKALDGAPRHLEKGIISALESLGTEASVDCLASWAGEDEHRIEQAIVVAEKVTGSKARRFLEGVAESSSLSSRIKARAKAAVQRVSGEETLNKLKQHEHEHEEGDNRRGDPLIKALGHEEREVRVAAIETLAKARRADAVEPLCELLNHEDRETVATSLTALATIGNSHAIPCLLRWSEGQSQRLVLVIQALTMIGGPESIQVLEMIERTHESESIRELAATGIARIQGQSKSPSR